MLSFLLDKCGTASSELPQLVRLNALLAEENNTNESNGSNTLNRATVAATMPKDTAAPPPRSSFSPPTPVSPTVQARKDHTMLGFLLDRCATAEERQQCPMLEQMRTWLSEEGTEEKAVVEQRADAPAINKAAVAATSAVSNNVASAAQHDQQQQQQTTAETSTTPPVMAIPLPILPGAGDWRGTITVHGAVAPVVSSPAYSSPIAPPCSTTAAPQEVTESTKDHKEKEEDGLVLSAPPQLPPHPPGAAAAAAAAVYAGRMPCPASEALAARNSATVRLLAGAGVGTSSKPSTRPSSSLPPASRPTSGFAKRLMADLYERVTSNAITTATPRAGTTSAAIPYSQAQLLTHATGSGVRAAREHHQHQQQLRYAPTGTEPWHAGAAAAVRGGSAQRAGRATPLTPSRYTPTPPPSNSRRHSGPDQHVGGRRSSLSRPPPPPLPPPVLPTVAGRPPRVLPAAVAAMVGRQAAPVPGCADPMGLMVVGARIRLPSSSSSSAAARSRYM